MAFIRRVMDAIALLQCRLKPLVHLPRSKRRFNLRFERRETASTATESRGFTELNFRRGYTRTRQGLQQAFVRFV